MNKFSFYKSGSAFWYLIIFGFSLSYTQASANKMLRPMLSIRQQNQISGTITDGTKPLAGVTISIKGKATTGTTSDFNGQYNLTVSPDDTLVFSFMGFITITEPINGRKTINIQLQEDATQLQEVKINAGYYSVKESERTGSISKITSKDIEKQPVTNVLAAMQGRMAGVSITQTTGVPGGGFDIQIRGLNSVRTNGNNPLYIIDGVPYSTDPIGSGQASPVLPGQPSPLNSINPEQIESIEVLKDADATAIYGSRGANGVVLITTKKGKRGGTQFTANVSKGVGSVTRFMDLLNTPQYLAMREQAFANDGISPLPNSAYDVNGTWDKNRYTDWQETLLGNTIEITTLSSSVSGGSAGTQYLASGSFNKQTTVFPGDFNYKKANFNLNVNHESENKRFRSIFTVGYTTQHNLQPREDLMTIALALAPNAPLLYKADGSLNWENSTWINPLSGLEGEYEAKTYDLIANAVLSYQIFKNFEIKSNFGYTSTDNNETAALPSTQYDPAYGVGASYSALKVGTMSRKSWIIEPQLNYKEQFGKMGLDVLAGSSFQSQEGRMRDDLGQGFPSNSLIYNLASASVKNILLTQEQDYRYDALFGRINLNWNSKYIVNLTGRRDGSSRFGPGKQFANFGAVGGAWLFSREDLLKDSKIVSFGKIRASYGVTGSDQIGDYQYLDTYASTGNNYGGIIGLEPARLFNPAFGWETNRKLEAALEAGFLNDRIFVTAGYYKNRSSNQLAGMPLPGTTGFSSIQSNLDATVENRGFEGTLRTVNVQTHDFNWTSNLNITVSRNKLVAFPDLESSTYKNIYSIGEPLNIKKVYQFTGVNPATGLYTFADRDGDGKITFNGDRTLVKDFNPQFFGGFQNSFRYKKLQLDFLLQFVKQENYNATAFFAPAGMLSQQPTSILDSWKQPGDITSHQMYTTGENGEAVNAASRYASSDAAISDASYIRLKNISLSYDLPLQFIKDMRCKVYVEGQNLLTFTQYAGADPEFKSAGYLPPLRILSAGLQITF